MNCDNASLLLYAVTDRSWLHGQTLYEQAEQALQGGATFLQLREKELDEAHFQGGGRRAQGAVQAVRRAVRAR